jgi:hypothetical protein
LPKLRVALIGSFRQSNYPKVVQTLRTFLAAGIDVTSPSGAEIVDGVEFVRFATDSVDASDEKIQTETLGRIFSSDAVYVITGPNGYVGRTTCYEIGRIVQRMQPIYFFERPSDLPVYIPPAHVVSPSEFMLRFSQNAEPTAWLYESGAGEIFDGERRLAGHTTFDT